MQLAVSPFVYRPHVEQDGVTITPDLSIRSVVTLDEAGRAVPVLLSALTGSPVVAPPEKGSAFQAAFTFTPATFGLLVGLALVTVANGTVLQVAAARTAWRYPALQGHADRICLWIDDLSAGNLDQWTASAAMTSGALEQGAMKQGVMAVAPTGSLIEGSNVGSAVSLILENRQEQAALTARYQVLTG